MNKEKIQLIRGLGLSATTSLVIGTVIGTGVFLKTAPMAQDTGTPGMVMAAWVAAGFLSLAGALTYAELGALLPHAGGEYVYLRQAYGETAAFLFGWMRFVAGSTGSIAIISVGFATFLSAIFPLTTVWAESTFTLLGQTIKWQFGTKQVVAVAAIMTFSILNCLTVAFGGRIQSLLTVLKIGGIAVVVGGVFFFSHEADWSHLATPAGTATWCGFGAFGTAMLAALWAYDGWCNMPMAAGEVKDPERNIPRALIFGMIVVILIYCLANLAYFYALPLKEVVTSNSTAFRNELPVAAKAAVTVFGEAGGKIVSIAFILSALGALNGSLLTGARVPFAMARDGLFFSKIGELSEGTRVPVYSIMVQAVWGSVLAISGTFDQLTDYVVFALWIFYGLVTSSVFMLRRKMPDVPRPYKTLGYPVMPFLFILIALWLVINTLINRPVESVAGLVLIGAGLPLYFYYRIQRRRAAIAPLVAETGD
ncbi:MAG TPA: amino acid permease [Blastocatellia bacterium]|nr:amino acid permease [Blastocatellia bacterium]